MDFLYGFKKNNMDFVKEKYGLKNSNNSTVIKVWFSCQKRKFLYGYFKNLCGFFFKNKYKFFVTPHKGKVEKI